MRQLDREDIQPLGPPIRREPESTPVKEWTPLPDSPHIEVDPSGNMRTNIPGNNNAWIITLPLLQWWER